jgi:hypothetical protein
MSMDVTHLMDEKPNERDPLWFLMTGGHRSASYSILGMGVAIGVALIAFT